MTTTEPTEFLMMVGAAFIIAFWFNPKELRLSALAYVLVTSFVLNDWYHFAILSVIYLVGEFLHGLRSSVGTNR